MEAEQDHDKQVAGWGQNTPPKPKLLGGEEIIKRAFNLPRIIFNDLIAFDKKFDGVNLSHILSVDCAHDSILVYGRYNKLARCVS